MSWAKTLVVLVFAVTTLVVWSESTTLKSTLKPPSQEFVWTDEEDVKLEEMVWNSLFDVYARAVNWTTEAQGLRLLEDYLVDLINGKGQEFLHSRPQQPHPFVWMLSSPTSSSTWAWFDTFPSVPPDDILEHHHLGALVSSQDSIFNVRARNKRLLSHRPIILPKSRDTLHLLLDVARRSSGNSSLLQTSGGGHKQQLAQFVFSYTNMTKESHLIPVMIKEQRIPAELVFSKMLRQVRRRKNRRKERRRARQQQTNNTWGSLQMMDMGPVFICLAEGSIPSGIDDLLFLPLRVDPQEPRRFRTNMLINHLDEMKEYGQRLFRTFKGRQIQEERRFSRKEKKAEGKKGIGKKGRGKKGEEKKGEGKKGEEKRKKDNMGSVLTEVVVQPAQQEL